MRVLIVKFGDIGDVVMTLPLLEEIRRGHNRVHITYLVGEKAAPILQYGAEIDRIIVVKEGKRSFAFLLRVWRALFGSFFDLALILYKDPRTHLFLAWSRVGEIRSFATKGLLKGEYQVRAMRTLFKEGALSWPSFVEKGVAKRVILAVGGGEKKKRQMHLRVYPIERYHALAGALLKEGFEVIVTGEKEDGAVRGLFQSLPVNVKIGETDLEEFIALIESSTLVISHDGGALHLATLFNRPYVGLFGPTNPREFLESRGPHQRILWGGEGLSCRPCYDGKSCALCPHARCMESFLPNHVLKEALLAYENRPHT